MTHTQLFDEVIQMATPYCIKDRDMTLVRKLKALQHKTQRVEDEFIKLSRAVDNYIKTENA